MGWLRGCFQVRQEDQPVLRHERNKYFTGALRAVRKVLIRRDKQRPDREHRDDSALLRPVSETYDSPRTLREEVHRLRNCGLDLATPDELKTSSQPSSLPAEASTPPESDGSTVVTITDTPASNVVPTQAAEYLNIEAVFTDSTVSDTPAPEYLNIEAESSVSDAPTAEYLNIGAVFTDTAVSDSFPDSKENNTAEDICLGRGDLFSTVLSSVENLPDKKKNPSKDVQSLPRTPATSKIGSSRSLGWEDGRLLRTPGSSGSKSYNSDDVPILGTVAAHWSNSPSPPKPWDGKGIPNSTTKYKEDQKVKWENTPFETRLERALANQTEASSPRQ